MFGNYGCGCNNGMNGNYVTPIIAPRRVCTSCSNQYVEQPVICPIECRHVNNVVYYPRYYPRYERTFMNQSNGNPYPNGASYDDVVYNGYHQSASGMCNEMKNGDCGCNH